MRLAFALLLLAACSAFAQQPGPGAADRVLRVCEDPNNLPFSNRAGEGFENKIAELLAAELGWKLEYTWFPQRMGFIRNTLRGREAALPLGRVRWRVGGALEIEENAARLLGSRPQNVAALLELIAEPDRSAFGDNLAALDRVGGAFACTAKCAGSGRSLKPGVWSPLKPEAQSLKPQEMTPLRTAYSTSSAVLWTLSFCSTRARCVSTVAALIDSSSATSRLLRPSATSWKISRSLFDSVS